MMYVSEINGNLIGDDMIPPEDYINRVYADLPDDGEGIGDNELWFCTYINMCLESCKALPLLTNIVRIVDDTDATHRTYIHIKYDAIRAHWVLEYMDYGNNNPFGWIERIFYNKPTLFDFLLKGGVWNE